MDDCKVIVRLKEAKCQLSYRELERMKQEHHGVDRVSLGQVTLQSRRATAG